MMLAFLLALAVTSRVLPLAEETVTVPAADWKVLRIPLQHRPARIVCKFSVESGGSGVRVALLDGDQFERMSAGKAYHPLAATDYRRSGGFAYAAAPGDYAVLVDNRMEGRGPAQVRLQVALIFDSGAPLPRTLSPHRRAVVAGLSILFFGAVVVLVGSKLWRAFRAGEWRPPPPGTPFPPFRG
jgi:hypothetical protein